MTDVSPATQALYDGEARCGPFGAALGGELDAFTPRRSDAVDRARDDYRRQAAEHLRIGRAHRVARLLLEAGADPNGEREQGFTPLIAAREQEDEAMKRLLVEHGATPLS